MPVCGHRNEIDVPFFRDPDQHLLEFIAMLPDVARPDVGVVAYSEWVSLVRTAVG